jgi:hypothetical protein
MTEATTKNIHESMMFLEYTKEKNDLDNKLMKTNR